MKELIFNLRSHLSSLGLHNGDGSVFDMVVGIIIVCICALISDWICRKLALLALHMHAKIRKRNDEETYYHKKLFSSIAAILPAAVISIVLPVVFEKDSVWWEWGGRFCGIYFIVMVLLSINSLLDFIYHRYIKPKNLNLPVNIFFQVCKYILIVIGGILVFSILSGKSPTALLTGVGASAAVISLVFKDSLVGLVAGFQLTANRMVSIGDWITIKKHNADGKVKEITLNTVKVENWDGTTTTLPPAVLLNDSFQNWKSMQDSNKRLVERSININMQTVKFCTTEDLEKYKKNELVRPYILKWEEKRRKKQAGDSPNEENDFSYTEDSLTNLMLFMIYIEQYFKKLPFTAKDSGNLVRQLQPDENGLPVQFRFFCKEIRWAEFEMIQSEVFSHIIAVINFFDLSVLQRINTNSITNKK